jgi:3-hydroxyisobutyrate dehydrogenase
MTGTAVAKNKLGWIGTGRMGFEMAARLGKAGCDIVAWNRTKAKADPLSKYGVKVATDMSELAQREIVFTMVSTSDDLKEVLFGSGGLLASSTAKPRIVVDCSSISIAASAEVRAGLLAQGIAFLASPVSGNAKVIKAGKLSVVCSGPQAVFTECEAYLRIFGPGGVSYVDDGELARIAKICHNVYLGVVTQSLAEITVLAQKAGLSRHAFLDFMNNSVMGSVFSRYKAPAFVNLDFKVTFTPYLLRKDMDLGLEAGRNLGVPLPLASVTRDLIQAQMGNGYTEQDFSTLLLLQAKASGMELEPENVPVNDGLS